ncbi:MAG: hypothetical protein GC134_05215 [Proteobacteria bacterium]|nr:hypothetical protein [Pseudomonadota bacterium]
MSAETFKQTLTEARQTVRQLSAASASEELESALRMDSLTKKLGTLMKTLEAMDPALWHSHKDDVIALMADITTMTESMNKRQESLRTQMNTLSQRIKAQNSYGGK